ncbi:MULTISPECIES: epoxyqueuosine reductase QueH [unclassified Lebetimonas]|uniref:epoxyqueuosine reductase QueH n=1 Tax=unclassified Lebetimonas TaxID=2648158 RepID=UPI000465392F|nr:MULTISPECIES: epoxyqueuosine reductase QueH [unclassified Lebetimonas]
MVVHLCCSVDAGYFIKRLKEDYPDEKITGYFYDPNIHPYSEFKLRSMDTKRICEKLGVEYIEGKYDYESWLKAVKGYEEEPEKGIRCSICFDHSLEATAKFAKKIGENKITTSLLMSPMKSQEQLSSIGKAVKRKYDVDFLVVDYRKKGGTQEQQLYAKENQLYRQDYCGCIYGIWQQKQNQEIIDELISPYPFQILPASIEERLNFYENRMKFEEKGVEYKIEKESFLNYRLLRQSVKFKVKSEIIYSYVLFYSYLDRKQRVRIEYIKNGVGYANRVNIIFIPIKKVNEILNKYYKNVKELFLKPLNIKEELKIRNIITNTPFNLSPIIVLDKLTDKTIDIKIEAKIYPDTREILI